jgi:hypothetical protein
LASPTPAPKPVSPFKKPKKAAGQKVVSPFLKPGQTKQATGGGTGQPGNPLGAGQAVIDILSMPMYSVVGKISALQKGNIAGAIFGAGEANALKWIWGERPETGADVLKNAGIKDPGFWGSLGLDIALDPTTYVGGAAIKIPLKLLTTGTKTVAKAGKIAATTGEIAAKAGSEGAQASKAFTPTYGKANKGYTEWKGTGPVPEVTNATPRQQRILAKQKALQTGAQKNIERFTYTTTLAPENRTLAVKIGDTLSSMVDAGVKSSASIITQEIAKRRLKIYAAKSAGVARKANKASKALAEAETAALVAGDEAVKAIDNIVESATAKTTEAPAAAPATPKTVAKSFTLEPLVDTGKTLRETVKDASLVSSSAEVKAATELLSKLDKAAKAAKVTKVSEGKSENVLKKILDPGKDKQVAYIENLPDYLIRRAKEATVRKQGTSPFEFFRSLTESSLKPDQSLAKYISNIPILDEDGAASTLLALAKKYPLDKNIPTPVMDQIVKTFDVIFNKVGTSKDLQKIRLKELTEELGKEFADKYKALTAGDKKLDINELVAMLPAPGTAAKGGYKTVEALLRGLRNGDQIETTSLKKILQALDPESKLEIKVEKAMSKEDAFGAYRDLLLKQNASVNEMRRRVNKTDPDMIFKAKNINGADVLAPYYIARLNNDIPVPDPVKIQTRQKAAERLDGKRQRNGNSYIENIGTLVSRVIDFDIRKMVEDMPFHQISNLGDYVARSIEGEMDAFSKAKRKFEFNENFGTGIAALAAARWRGRKMDKVLKGKASSKEILKNIAEDIHTASDLTLSGMGARFIVKEQAVDVKEGQAAHLVFLEVGDFIDASFLHGFDDIAERMVIPFTDNKNDSVSFTGLMDAIRMVLQGADTKNMPTKAMIAKRIRSVGEEQKKLSPAYKAEMKTLSEQLAEELFKPEVIKTFQDIHSARALADVEDALQPGITMMEEVWDKLVEAWRVVNENGSDSPTVKAEQARRLFAEFAYISHIFDQSYGPAAESVFRAMSMAFIKDGEIAGIKRVLRPEDEEAWARLRIEMNSYFKQAGLRGAAPAGREHLPFPTDAAKNTAERMYTKARNEIEQHLTTITSKTTKQEVANWNRTLARLAKNLEKARNKAWERWLPTEHWMYDAANNRVQWVPSTQFDEKLAAELADKNRVIITTDGAANIGNVLHDKNITAPAPKLTPAQKKASAKKIAEAADVRAGELAEGAREDAFVAASKLAQEIRNMTEGEFDGFMRLEQERLMRPLLNSEIKTYLYDPAWKLSAKVSKDQQVASRAKNIQKHLSSTAGNVSIQQIAVIAESKLMGAVQNVADVFTDIARRYDKILSAEDFRKGFTLALRRGEAVSPSENNLVNEFAKEMRKVLDPIMEELGPSSSLSRAALDQMFEVLNLNMTLGIKKPSDVTDLTRLLDKMPFTEPTKDIAAETMELAKWNERASNFEKANGNPFVIINSFITAIQNAKTVQAIGLHFAKEFSHLAQGVPAEQALKEGWVELKAIPGSGIDLTVGIPKGMLFPEYMAEGFMFMNRNYSGLIENPIKGWTRTLLDLTGMVKATQTIIKPSYHIVNGISDSVTSVMQGATHASDWIAAFKVVKQWVGEDIAAGWGPNAGVTKALGTKGIDNLSQEEIKYNRALRRMQGVGSREYENITKNGIVTAVVNGKTKSLDISQLINVGEDSGGLLNSLFDDRVLNLYDEVISNPIKFGTEAEHVYNKELGKTFQEGVRRAASKFQQTLKPVGDFAAYYGNFARMATAISVIRRGNFKSDAEMLREISEAVSRNHPTLQSLTAFERKRIRPITTYYTWLRVAHGAMFKLVTDHTAAVLLYPKVQYELSQEQGYEPNSFGKPWDTNKQVPSFLSNSVFGPITEGPNGPMVWKPSILPMDVLDNYSGFSYDPAYTGEQNIFKGINATQSLVGKNINTLLQLPLEFATKTDVRYGTPSTVKDLPTLADRLFSMTAFSGIAQGVGYNPPGKELTDRERELKNISFLVGGKPIDVNKESYQKYSQKEQSARMKAFLEQYSQNK